MRAKRCLCAALVALVTALAFVRSAGFGAVNCDDHQYLGTEPRALADVVRNVEHAIWMPVTYLAYGCDHRLSGGGVDGAARAAHVGNVIWHAADAVLLFLLLLSVLDFRGSRRPEAWALVCALLWSVHPLRCESVAWIASKKDVISGFFLLAALLAWVRWRIRGGGVRYALALACVAFGAMAKPSVMVFVGIVAVLDGCLFRPPLAWKSLVAYLLPLGLCLGIAAEASVAQAVGDATGTCEAIPLWWRALNAVTSVGVYIRNTALPVRLAPQCLLRYPAAPAQMLVAVPLALAAGVGTVRLARRKSVHLLGPVWFLGALVPFLGLLGFGYHAFADRFTYIPAMGLSVGAVLLADRLGRRGLAFGGLLVCAFFALAWRQTGFWQNDLVLWQRTLAVDGKRNTLANLNLATWYWEMEHDAARCCSYFAEAWKVNPALFELRAMHYVAALLECGDRRTADTVVIGLRDLVREMSERGESVRRIRMVREMCNILIDASDPETVGRAERAFAELTEGNPKAAETDQHLLFLRAKIAEGRQQPEKARELYYRCTEAAAGDSVVRYRFLNGKRVRH